jgi:hypothetical protein
LRPAARQMISRRSFNRKCMILNIEKTRPAIAGPSRPD